MQIAASNGIRRSITYGRKHIAYNLIRCNRKTMEIAVHPDGSIVVKAPLQSDVPQIEYRLVRRARWILRQIDYFKQFQPRTPVRCHVNGETHQYLGRQYRLRVVHGDKDSVKLSQGFFQVTCRHDASPDSVRKLLNRWYLDKAKQQFADSLERCWPKFENDGRARPRLLIRKLKKRWGSLSENGTITLNTDLVKAPRECIDYVITHELCHTKVPNHSAEFFDLLESMMPDWKKTKLRLELSLS